MKSRKTLIVFGIVVVLFLAGTSLGSIPHILSFQAHLTDTTGRVVANGFYDITARIYDVPTGVSPPLWEETHVRVLVQKGYCNLLLGTVTPFPPDIFDGPDRYLAIKIGSDPEMEPRQRITSVGYAYVSEKAQKAESADWGDLDNVPDDLADGDDIGFEKLRADGFPWITDSATFVPGANVNLMQAGGAIRISAELELPDTLELKQLYVDWIDPIDDTSFVNFSGPVRIHQLYADMIDPWHEENLYFSGPIEVGQIYADMIDPLEGDTVYFSAPIKAPGLGGGVGGDDWGDQVVEHNPTLDGNGTVADLLRIAQQDARNGQVLKWSEAESTWLPGDDIAGGVIPEEFDTLTVGQFYVDWIDPILADSTGAEHFVKFSGPIRVEQIYADMIDPWETEVVHFSAPIEVPGIDCEALGSIDTLKSHQIFVDWIDPLCADTCFVNFSGPIRAEHLFIDVVESWHGDTVYFDVPIKAPAYAGGGGGGGGYWAQAGSLLYPINPGNIVGIRTSAPEYTLDVNGDGRFTSNLTVGAYTLPNYDGDSAQVLKTDGAGVLLWANDVGGGAGDDWGAQVVESDATLEGDGTVGYELKIAQQGALDGQVLKWDSLGTWLPADDIAGDNDWSGAGTGMMYATHIDDNVGIGTVSPMHKLDVLGSVNISDSLFIGTVPFDFSHDMILTINGGRVMKYWADSICDNGWSGAGTGNIYATDTTDYVGIGTTAPSYKLDVHGMARITDGLYLDYLSEDPVHDTVLTIDGGQVKKVAAGALGGGASKYRWATHHQYSCNSPELTYIPINSEEDTTAISSRQVRWLAPCDGQLLKVVIMTDFVAGSTQVGFHTNMNSVATETQVVDITMSDTPFVAMFSTAVFNEGDMLHISVAPGADPGVVWVTCYYESN